MIGNLDVALDVFLTGSDVREHGSHQVVGAHALNLRRDFLATVETEEGQSAASVPAPASAKEWGGKRGLLENRLHSFCVQEMKHVGQWKTMLLGQSNIQAIVSSCCLQFEVEAAAEALAQCQSPGFIDASAEGGMNYQLHASTFVKETLGDNGVLGRNVSQNGAALQDVLNRLLGAGVVETALLLQPGDGFRDCGLGLRNANRKDVAQTIADLFAQIGHMEGQLLGAGRSFAAPEGDGGRRTMRVFDQHPAGFAFYAMNAPRSVAEQHDIAGIGFDREVLVHGTNHRAFRLSDHGEQSILWDRAAAGDGRQPRPTPRAQLAIHPITVQVGAVAAAPGGNTLGKHFEDRVVSFASQVAVGIGASDKIEEFVFVPAAVFFFKSAVCCRANGHDLLGENVSGSFGNHQAIEIAVANCPHQRGAFLEFVTSGGKEPPFRNRTAPVAGTSNPL